MHPVALATVIVTAAAVTLTARADDDPEPAPAQRFGYGLAVQKQMDPAPWRTPSGLAAPAGVSSALVMGVSMRTGERSTLAWQTPLAVAKPGAAAREGILPQRQGEMQVAWTLRSRDPVAAFRGTPFKYQLSGQTVVALKPRKSKLSVTLQHEW